MLGGGLALRAREGMDLADDFRDVFNDTSEPLGSLDPGSTATGTIEEVFDGDIFAVTLVAGRTYAFSMRGASSG